MTELSMSHGRQERRRSISRVGRSEDILGVLHEEGEGEVGR